jgi:hypothetical protein
MKVSEAVKKYIELRDQRDERKRRFTEEDAADKALQEKIEATLLQVFEKTGLDSCKTEFGTAYTSNRSTASVADKEVFMQFITEKQEWPLLEVRAAKTAVEQYKEVHGSLPPGINYREELVVNIRRSA